MTEEKKKKKGVFWKIVLGLFVLMIIGSVLSGGDEEPTTTKTETTSEQAEESDDGLGLGESYQGRTWEYTVHGARLATVINEQDNEFITAESGETERFLIVDFEIKNVTKETQAFSTMISAPDIRTNDGYTYDENTEASMALKQGIDGGQINPGLSFRGELAFKIPNESDGVIFEISEEPDANWDLTDHLSK